jgi:hypothetical protein
MNEKAGKVAPPGFCAARIGLSPRGGLADFSAAAILAGLRPFRLVRPARIGRKDDAGLLPGSTRLAATKSLLLRRCLLGSCLFRSGFRRDSISHGTGFQLQADCRLRLDSVPPMPPVAATVRALVRSFARSASQPPGTSTPDSSASQHVTFLVVPSRLSLVVAASDVARLTALRVVIALLLAATCC